LRTLLCPYLKETCLANGGELRVDGGVGESRRRRPAIE
jgi:hypothetical protein